MTKEIIEVPAYDSSKGAQSEWVTGFEIHVRMEGSQVHIAANREGLLSLAKQLLFLAQEAVPKGCHFHFDEHTSLEEGSVEMVIERK